MAAEEIADSAQAQYDRMTKTPVHRLILVLSVPTTVSVLVTNLYNMADTFFVSQVGTSASGATGVVFALMAIIQAFGFMFGHGAGSNISRHLGARDVASARKYASTSFFLSILTGLLIAGLGFLFQDPLMRLLGSTDSILPYAREYSSFILVAAPAMASGCVMNNILRYEGKATFAMFGLASGGILNIFGDAILIMGFHLGMRGAGISTAVSQYISAVILFMPFALGKVQSRLSLKYVTHSLADVKNILACGFPSLVRQGMNSVSMMFLNQCASAYGDAAIAAMSIVSRIINFLFCVALGIGQGFQPVSSFNYGAKKYSRVREAFWFSLRTGMLIMAAMALAGLLFSPQIVRLFRDDEQVIETGVVALRAQCFSLLLMPVCLCANMLFQSIGKSAQATFLASIRSGLVFIPVLFLLSRTLGLFGIEIAQVVSDFIAAIITIPMVVPFLNSLPVDDAPD